MGRNKRYPRLGRKYGSQAFRFRSGQGRVRDLIMAPSSFARSLVPDTGSFKLRGFYTVTSTGAGGISNGFRLTQPDNFDGGGTALQDWNSLANLYDSYKVTGMSLQWIPAVPNDSTATTAYRPLYVFMDIDSVGLTPTDNQALQYANCKVKDMSKPWKAYFKIPALVNTSGTTVASPGWMDTATPTQTGSVYISRQSSLTNSTVYGTVILSYYIKVHIRK